MNKYIVFGLLLAGMLYSSNSTINNTNISVAPSDLVSQYFSCNQDIISQSISIILFVVIPVGIAVLFIPICYMIGKIIYKMFRKSEKKI